MKETNAKPGDYVELHLMHKIYEGVLLESPEGEREIVLLKVDNGYNIGFNRNDVIEIKVKKKFVEEKESFELKKDKEKPNIALVITGGTIASFMDSKTGGVTYLDSPEKLMKLYSKEFENVNVVKIVSPFMKWSEDMDYKDWKTISKEVYELLEDPTIKGVIITHGTDTLHFTSAALSFFLRNINKPVVLTYSQRSVDRGSSDAFLNLKCSALVAVSDIAEVMLVGHANSEDDFCYAMPATKVRKLHTSKRDAFKIVNSTPFAKIYSNRIEMLPNSFATREKTKDKMKLDNKFEEKVALVKFYPGQDPAILDYYLDKGYKGIVVEFVGIGQVATKNSRANWLTKLKEVQKKGLIVCAAAQTIFGRLDPLVYSAGRDLEKTGVIYLKDMLSETAFVKLSWVLGHSEWASSKEKVKEIMLTNFNHEFSERLIG